MSEKRKQHEGSMWTRPAEPERRLLSTTDAPTSDARRAAAAGAEQQLRELTRPFTTVATHETLNQSTAG